MEMDKFLREYDGVALDDDIMVNSEEVKSFSRKFKNYLKRGLPDCEIVGYRLGHYDLFTFIKQNGKYIYLSYNIPRHGKRIDINCGKNGFDPYGLHSVLVRTADGPKDYHGGTNNYCSIATIPEAVNALFERGYVR